MIEPKTEEDMEMFNKGKYFMFSETAYKHSKSIADKISTSLSEVNLVLIPVDLHYKNTMVRLVVFKVKK
jgi:hypothetical protein